MHYVGVVIAENEEAVTGILAPFDMNLQTEPHLVEDRAEWLDEYRSEIESDLRQLKVGNRSTYLGLDEAELKRRQTLPDDELAAIVIPEREKQGAEYDEDGNLLDHYNERGAWDYWSIGGRWEADFRTMQGVSARRYANLLEAGDYDGLPDIISYIGSDEEPEWEDRFSARCDEAEDSDETWKRRLIEVLHDYGDKLGVYFVDFHE